MKKENIIVEGMTCNHCKMAVEKAVSSLDGVKSAKVDLAKKNLAVKYDESQANEGAIKQAVIDAGYKPE